MKAFVTGATGLLGNHLVSALLGAGYQVKGLVRSPEKARFVFPNREIELVSGDMRDVDSFASALRSCDILFHTAAYCREYYQPGNHEEILERVNVRGTIDLLRASAEHGLRKAIFISTAGTVGPRADGSPGDEDSLPDDASTSNHYFASKMIAELAIQQFLREHVLPVVSILPGWMWGPRDWAPTSSGRLTLEFLAQHVPVVLDGGSCVVDVRDVAAVCLTAVERGRSGQRYIVGGPYYDFRRILAALEAASGVSAPRISLPHPLMLRGAHACELWCRLTGRPALITREGVRALHAHRNVVSKKAVCELGATFRPFRDTVTDQIAWFREQSSRQSSYGGALKMFA